MGKFINDLTEASSYLNAMNLVACKDSARLDEQMVGLADRPISENGDILFTLLVGSESTSYRLRLPDCSATPIQAEKLTQKDCSNDKLT